VQLTATAPRAVPVEHVRQRVEVGVEEIGLRPQGQAGIFVTEHPRQRQYTAGLKAIAARACAYRQARTEAQPVEAATCCHA